MRAAAKSKKTGVWEVRKSGWPPLTHCRRPNLALCAAIKQIEVAPALLTKVFCSGLPSISLLESAIMKQDVPASRARIRHFHDQHGVSCPPRSRRIGHSPILHWPYPPCIRDVT